MDIIKSNKPLYRNSGPISIKMKKAGNKSFNLYVIKDIKGIEPFSELRGQVLAFQDTTYSIINKITQHKLYDYHVRIPRWQREINSFCRAVLQLGALLRNASPEEAYQNKDIRLAVKEIVNHNRPILLYFLSINQEIDQNRHEIDTSGYLDNNFDADDEEDTAEYLDI